MRPIRNAAYVLVAAGSVALAAWQPSVRTDAGEAEVAVPAGVAKPVDGRVPATTIERAVLTAPLVRA